MPPRITLDTYPLYPNSPTATGSIDRYAFEKAINGYVLTANAGGMDSLMAFIAGLGASPGSNTSRALDALTVNPGGDFETLILSPWLLASAPAGVGVAPGAVADAVSTIRQIAGQQSLS